MTRYEAIRDPEMGSRSPTTPAPDLINHGRSFDSLSQEEDIGGPRKASPLSSSPNRRLPRQNCGHRVGYWGLLVFAVGILVILASCSVLIFLWWGSDDAKKRNEPALWKSIVFRSWATRVVTLCSAAIRVAMGLQTGLITAAAAAIILETSGVKFYDTAILSIERALGSSPFNILPAALRQGVIGDASRLLHCLIVVLAFLIGLVSTFISTILLSDFDIDYVAAQSTTKTLAIGLNTMKLYNMDYDETAFLNGASYWKASPGANWRFAEAKIGEPLSTKGVADTGDVYRALLPFESPLSRTSLEYYSGPAIVTNFRTACVAPTFDSFKLEYPDNARMSEGVYLEASVRASIDGIDSVGSDDEPLEISCKLHNDWDETSPNTWPLSLCGISYGASATQGPKDPLSGFPYIFHEFLLLNSSAPLNGVTSTYDEEINGKVVPKIPNELRNLKTKNEGLWTRAVMKNGSDVFSASICFISGNLPQMYNVTMSGHTVLDEPLVDWRRLANPGSNQRVLRQLGIGASSMDLEQRGILDLEVKSGAIDYMSSVATTLDHKRGYADPYLSDALNEYNSVGGWSMRDNNVTKNLVAENQWAAHAAHTSIVQGIIHETQNPAIAMQALTFRIYQMIYYSWQQSFDLLQPVTTINSAEMSIPARWTGLYVVLVLVGVHLALVVVTVVLFLLRTRASCLGNAWQAVSQMVSPRTMEVIEEASELRNKEVKELAKSTGLGEGAYGVSRSARRGKIGIRKLRARR